MEILIWFWPVPLAIIFYFTGFLATNKLFPKIIDPEEFSNSEREIVVPIWYYTILGFCFIVVVILIFYVYYLITQLLIINSTVNYIISLF